MKYITIYFFFLLFFSSSCKFTRKSEDFLEDRFTFSLRGENHYVNVYTYKSNSYFKCYNSERELIWENKINPLWSNLNESKSFFLKQENVYYFTQKDGIFTLNSLSLIDGNIQWEFCLPDTLEPYFQKYLFLFKDKLFIFTNSLKNDKKFYFHCINIHNGNMIYEKELKERFIRGNRRFQLDDKLFIFDRHRRDFRILNVEKNEFRPLVEILSEGYVYRRRPIAIGKKSIFLLDYKNNQIVAIDGKNPKQSKWKKYKLSPPLSAGKNVNAVKKCNKKLIIWTKRSSKKNKQDIYILDLETEEINKIHSMDSFYKVRDYLEVINRRIINPCINEELLYVAKNNSDQMKIFSINCEKGEVNELYLPNQLKKTKLDNVSINISNGYFIIDITSLKEKEVHDILLTYSINKNKFTSIVHFYNKQNDHHHPWLIEDGIVNRKYEHNGKTYVYSYNIFTLEMLHTNMDSTQYLVNSF